MAFWPSLLGLVGSKVKFDASKGTPCRTHHGLTKSGTIQFIRSMIHHFHIEYFYGLKWWCCLGHFLREFTEYLYIPSSLPFQIAYAKALTPGGIRGGGDIQAARGRLTGWNPGSHAICEWILTVTTRIITFLVGDPYLNLHLPQASWEGGQPNVS